MWNGSDPAGRTILVHVEQAYGDTIQFVRYVPMLAARGARVILETFGPLKSLLEQSQLPSTRIVVNGEQLPAFDVHIPLLSLPRIFGTTLDTIPATVPYLSVSPDEVSRWRDRIFSSAPDAKALKVGLVWAGNAKPYPNRTCPPEYLSRLSEIGEVAYFSVQKGDDADPARSPPRDLPTIDLSVDLNDFSDTAAAMLNLDLIISIDTVTAHLAGALGRPTWTLLPRVADWRWLLDREDSPWYPTMRLYRQTTAGDWAGVIARVVRDLSQLASRHAASRASRR